MLTDDIFYGGRVMFKSQTEFEAYKARVAAWRNRNTAVCKELHKRKQTAAELAKDPNFVELCSKAGVQPTPRQASKYRNGKGAAFNAK